MPNLPSRSTSPENPRASTELVDAIFAKMGSLFGAKWLDMWANANLGIVKHDWAILLRDVTPEQVRAAFQAMIDRGQAFPPSAPEFVHLCRQFRVGPETRRIVDARRTAPAGFFQSLRDVLAKQP
jgi:hypothetical protein